MRWGLGAWRALAVALVNVAGAASADTVEGLYQGTAIVTGQDNSPERTRGITEALQQVLIKVSGDARLAADPRRWRVLERASEAVVSLRYQDRLAGKKLMDEQGTRERSHVLTVTFDPAKVDQVLASLDRRPWGPERPRVLAVFGIRDTVGVYVLGTESDRGYGQRETLLAHAQRRGVPLVLPRMDKAEREGLSFAEVAETAGPALERLRAHYGASAVLIGTMTLEVDGLWTTQAELRHAGGTARWRVERASFDRALTDGIDRVARVLAGLDGGGR